MSIQPKDSIIWRCPSNIAIIKYWGKRGNQIPANSSVSLTLSESFTEVELEFEGKKEKGIELEYYFENQKKPEFEERILRFVQTALNDLPVFLNSKVIIKSKNSFPHSAGIASSASSFGALALALLDASFPRNYENNNTKFLDKASFIARLGSGSACRSMFAPFALWGENQLLKESYDEMAIPVSEVHPEFRDIQDDILIVDSSPKKFSSSLGHSLMKGHAFAESRFAQANQRTPLLINVLANGDWRKFINITESEALTLHAMMLSSEEPFILMKPQTLQIIERIQNFRKETGLPICFTLDAGPNVHVIYSSKIKDEVNSFLNTFINSIGIDVINDKSGNGPVKIR